jgi:hypothetical protein
VTFERLNRGFPHLDFLHLLPCDVVAGREREMAKKLALRPSGALSKRMKSIQLAQVVRRSVAEPCGAEPDQTVFVRKSLEERRGRVDNVSMVGEQVTTLADVDGTHLSSPIVQVPEQISVHSLQVREVEATS